ncbi:MAG: hypothetical protein WCN81_04655 [Actinomycetes bacterium]
MDDSLEQLLADVAAGLVPAPDAADRLRRFGYAAVGDYARLDVSRAARKGVPEVVYAAGKTSEQLVAIVARFLQHGPVVLCSRVSPEQAAALAAGVDAENVARLTDLLAALHARGTTVIVITPGPASSTTWNFLPKCSVKLC